MTMISWFKPVFHADRFWPTRRKEGATASIRDYARSMVVSYIPVVDELNAILPRKNLAAPLNTLLRGGL